MEQAGNARNPITLLIAVAVRLYRDGLAAVLQAQSQLRVVGTAATPLDAQAASRNFAPHVVIVDVSMDGALDLMRAVRAESARKSHSSSQFARKSKSCASRR